MKTSSSPRTPRDIFKLPIRDRILINGLIALFRWSGIWKYARQANGDIEKMTYLDKVYWLYKTTFPVREPRRNSNLKTYFEDQKRAGSELPTGFQIESELSLSAVGDLINHPYLRNSSETLYQKTSELIFGTDLAMANLECPILANAGKEFVFAFDAAPPLYYSPDEFSVVKGTHGRNFTFMATACNHSLDFGIEGVEATLRILKDDRIFSNGVNSEERDANRATIIERNGIRIGLVAYTFGLNGHKPPLDRPNVVNRMNMNDGVAANDFLQLHNQISFCHENAADFLIAHLHWGLEHEFYPTPEQVELAHYVAELGIDAIIGHHPHVLQPLEFYRTKRDPERVVPIYYSLGNLVNFFSAEYLCRSGVSRISLAMGKRSDGARRVYVKAAKLVEVRQQVDESRKTLQIVAV